MNNNSFISNSIIFNKGSDKISNSEFKSGYPNKNKGISFNDYAILNSISSDRSGNYYNNNVKINPYDNHIIYEDDYLLDKNKNMINNKNKNFSSPNKLKNNLVDNLKYSLIYSPNTKENNSLLTKKFQKFETPVKNNYNSINTNKNQINYLVYSERNERTLLPKLIKPYNQKEKPNN